MTKEKLEILVNSWDGMGLGTNGGDVVPKLQSAQSNTLITSVTSVPPYLLPHLILPSALERINDKLRDVSKHAENAGYMGSNVASELDEIITAIANCQASSEAQTGSAIHITNFNEPSLLYLHPPYLENHPHRRRGLVSAVTS